MVRRSMIVLFMLALVLTACGKEVRTGGSETLTPDYITTTVKDAKSASLGVENVVKEYLSSGEFPDLSEYSSVLKTDLQIKLPAVVGVISERTSFFEVSDNFKTTSGIEVRDYLSADRYSLSVYYFTDDETAITEQMFLFRIADGSTAGLIFKWLGGTYIEAGTVHVASSSSSDRASSGGVYRSYAILAEGFGHFREQYGVGV